MTAKLLTIIGLALVLGAAICFYYLGGEDLAATLVGIIGGGLGGGALATGGVWPGGDSKPGGYVRVSRLAALIPLASMLVYLSAAGGCAPGYSARIQDWQASLIRAGSSLLLLSAPLVVRAAGEGKWWSEPVARTIEASTPTIMQGAEAALTECVEPGTFVDELMKGIALSLAAWAPLVSHVDGEDMDASVGECDGGEMEDVAHILDQVRPIVTAAVEAAWPSPAGYCPHLFED